MKTWHLMAALEHGGPCEACGDSIPAAARAWWNHETRKLRCYECHSQIGVGHRPEFPSISPAEHRARMDAMDAAERTDAQNRRSDTWERANNQQRHNMIKAANNRAQKERRAELERQADELIRQDRAHKAHQRRQRRMRPRRRRP